MQKPESGELDSPFCICSLNHSFFLPSSCTYKIFNLHHHPFLLPIQMCSKSFILMLGDRRYRNNRYEHISLHLTLSARNPQQFASLTSRKILLIHKQMKSFPFLLVLAECVAVIQKKNPKTVQLHVIHSLYSLTNCQLSALAIFSVSASALRCLTKTEGELFLRSQGQIAQTSFWKQKDINRQKRKFAISQNQKERQT